MRNIFGKRVKLDEDVLSGGVAVPPQRMLRRAGKGRRVIHGCSSLEVTKGHHHGVQHVRDVERGEFQVGTLRDLLGFAFTSDLARTADASYLVREYKR